jgi:predicted adenine nucleotide alpha hydrolase (AANH) superfamily ATPase
LLVHICCSVDSHYFLQKIQEEYPEEKIVGFFYDPNIQPYSEYKLRLFDVQYSCKKLGIELIEGPYDLNEWLIAVKGLEDEPEKGDRCTVCFDKRLETTVLKAKELKHDKFTTTLLISPKKSQDKLDIIGNDLQEKYKIQFVFKDYRSGNGQELQGKEVKSNALYRQNYCGCLFGLMPQREQQNKLMDEMINPISNQIMPESIEQRLVLYAKRNLYDQYEKKFKIIKKRFLNYRLLNAKVVIQKQSVFSHFLPYSTINKNRSVGRIEYSINNIHYFNKDEIKIIDIHTYNQYANTTYKTVQELVYQPPKFKDEVNIKSKILNNNFDVSCLIVLDDIPSQKMEVHLNTKTYEDVEEELIVL